MKTILLTGANGQVGWELRRALEGKYKVIAPSREQLDLCRPDAIRQFVNSCRPDIIINPAAYTAVDKAETEPELAMSINGIAPGIFAEVALELDALLIHYSTDYVFDGLKSSAYTELDTPNPQSVYGRTKLAGEEAIKAAGCRHLILRTSWVYGTHGGNFVKTVIRLAKERDEMRIVADQFGAPTWARLLANSTSDILQSWYAGKATDQPDGLYHLTACGRTSWHHYAGEIVQLAMKYDASISSKPPRILPIATREYPLPAKRPANSSLSNDKVQKTFGLKLPAWQDDLADCVRELYTANVTPD
ncbi:MAG: dTDP-4-dehydrorhamnose reductase [Pseudomonadota bacterium]